MQGQDKAIKSFLIESDENLAQLEQDIVALEKAPGNGERVSSAFRAIHTIKGTCGFFGFPNLERLGHAIEDVLGSMRDGDISMDLDFATVLLDGVDATREYLNQVSIRGDDGGAAPDKLVERLQALLEKRRSSTQSAEQDIAAATDGDLPDDTTNTDTASAGTGDNPQESYAEKSAPSPAEATVRVDVNLLDKLMNVVGELVLTRNQLLQHTANQDDAQLVNLAQRLNLVTSELQEGLMQTRMQPIRNAWSTYPRLLLELEKKTGKRVTSELKGGDTELDRSLLEAIRDPLIHLVRNAVDHGIETPDVRRQRGKPETGQLTLSAYHESGNVTVEVSDDGGGLNSEKITQRAIDVGLLRPEQAEQLSDRERICYLFEPGFSTSEEVNDLSGRGVGLDVVRTNVEKIGGSIDIHSEPGTGTSIALKIPLTLAIVPALIVRCLHQRFAIPQLNLMEVVCVNADNIDKEIETVHDALVYRLRGRLLPLVDLRSLLKMGEREKEKDQFILVLTADQKEFGLLVDDVRDTEEIVVKPLGQLLKDNPCFAGATIMGDGRVALILDVNATANFAGVSNDDKSVSTRESSADIDMQQINAAENYLIVKPKNGRGRCAIALSRVSRLEEVSRDLVEYSAGREVIQYRDEILPLVRLGNDGSVSFNPDDDGREQDVLKIVVQSTDKGSVGIVVDDIIDIVTDENAEVKRSTTKHGVLGSGVLQGRVTDFIDCEAAMEIARSDSKQTIGEECNEQ